VAQGFGFAAPDNKTAATAETVWYWVKLSSTWLFALSYATSMERIDKGLRRMDRYFRSKNDLVELPAEFSDQTGLR
jgi:hypothetical protein